MWIFYHEEDLLQSLDTVFVPGCADVNAAGLTTDQVLRQQHDETLREEKRLKKACVDVNAAYQYLGMIQLFNH